MKKLMETICRNKKNLISLCIIILLAVSAMVFTCNDYFLYSNTIADITSVEEKLTGETDTPLNSTEKEYSQKIIAQIKNGDYKGQQVVITNHYSSSQVTTEKYSVGDDIFISLSSKGDTLKATVDGFKRDGYFVFVIVSFVTAILIVGRRKGFLSVVSVLFNIALFVVAIELYFKGINLFLLCCISSILFTTVSLTLVSGLNKKTACAVISTLAGTAVTIIIAVVVLKITKGSGVRFEQMEYLIRPYEVIFISELLIGGLGAIMDISITMSSSMAELIEKNNNISYSALRKSGREIGKDVMGTMVNVLFFTYVCGCVPLIVLALRNNATFTDIMENYISLEIDRSFVGSIGIVLTIPIAIFICSHFLKGGRKK